MKTTHKQNIDGARVDALLEKCEITVNKNSVPGDTKPFVPGGVRLGNLIHQLEFMYPGTPALTTRGLVESDFEKVADFIDRGIKIAIKLNGEGNHYNWKC